MEKLRADDAGDHRAAAAGLAAVHGVATAAGCRLIATCRPRVASEQARFATPGVDIGLFCSSPAVPLARNVPPPHPPAQGRDGDAAAGEMIPAAEAHRIGLVNRVVPAEQVMETAHGLARHIAARSAMTVRLGKQAFYRQVG